MIYLARNGKIFGPFSHEELNRISLADYSWIFDEAKPDDGWTALDRAPAAIPGQANSVDRDCLIFHPLSTDAVSGLLLEAGIHGGRLLTNDAKVRIEPGTPVRLQLGGQRSFAAVVRAISYHHRQIAYDLSWQSGQAPDLHSG